jgi:hypothetical protein
VNALIAVTCIEKALIHVKLRMSIYDFFFGSLYMKLNDIDDLFWIWNRGNYMMHQVLDYGNILNIIADDKHCEMDKIRYTPETSLPVTSGLQSMAYPSSLWPLNTFTGRCLWIMSSSLGAAIPDSAKELRKELKSQTCIFSNQRSVSNAQSSQHGAFCFWTKVFKENRICINKIHSVTRQLEKGNDVQRNDNSK